MRTKAFYLTRYTLTIPARTQRTFVKRLNALMMYDYIFTTTPQYIGDDGPTYQDYLDTIDDSCYA